jgi:uncharacterized protein
MPGHHYISRLFGISPVKPIQDHMDNVIACAEELLPFLRDALAGDWASADRRQERIGELENVADDYKRELRLQLPHSMFMPVARADLLDLLSVQDRVANKTKDISGLIRGRRMRFPETIGDDLMAFAERALDAARQAHKTVHELDELFETSFGGAEAEIVKGMIKELDHIENDTDGLEVKLRARLFEIERDLNPVDVMFMYKVIEWIGDLADWSQRIGARLQLLLAR